MVLTALVFHAGFEMPSDLALMNLQGEQRRYLANKSSKPVSQIATIVERS